MIDFKNGAVFKLTKSKSFSEENTIRPLLIPGEEILGQYSGIRDFIVFTNKRIIAVNIQGITGKKKDFTSLPYSKIQLFSVETAGVLDLDSELDLYFSGVGKIRFEFSDSSNISEIARIIGQYVLD